LAIVEEVLLLQGIFAHVREARSLIFAYIMTLDSSLLNYHHALQMDITIAAIEKW